MSFITYAQNGEDVLLWRALGHLRNGFYIDVGANDPVLHSVTKAFYDAGWSGINIEPLPSFHQAFLTQRPRDINLAVAAGATEASITLFDVPSVNGWASTDQQVAAAHRAEGYELAELQVPLRTLSAICAEHVQGEIHFLKVDVEGFEGEVLRGMDWQRWRPWVLVIEATLPNSRVTNHDSWEHLVTTQGYRYAYFDGLNRYYVADEHAELLDALQLQPNVFDDYLPGALVQAWAHGEDAEQRATQAAQDSWDAQARQQVAEAETEAVRAHLASTAAQLAASESALAASAHQLQAAHADIERGRVLAAELNAERAAAIDAGVQASAWAQDLEQRLLATYASTSWRITRPLRASVTGLQRSRQWLLNGSRSLLRRTVSWLTKQEALRRLILPRLAKVPGLDAKVTELVARAKQTPPPVQAAARQQSVAPELRDLSAATRRALAVLQPARPTPEE
ncbi:MAG: FkbM family methyltransferase [Sphingomonadaceae bacterium]